MPLGVAALSEREKQVLRMLLHGHDAKSIARELDLSVHTVNEHLREARRKSGVSSSREAARRLAESEDTDSIADKKFGVVGAPRRAASRRLNWLAGGLLIMSLIIAAAALTPALHASRTSPAGAVPEVITASPRQGATIKPGPLLLSVTFDRPMQPGSYSFAGDPKMAPENCGNPEQSRDGRTYSMHCTVSPGRTYEIWFNRGDYMNFRSAEGVSAQPYRLSFKVRRN
jgi:DNA-binding CsgD family transcriptional regulator